MSGRVAFVGAGPGDPGLLTARALELIAAADTILYDRLIPPQALDGARGDAELLYVGKEGGGESVAQEEIEALLLERARGGALVVRLKGGDPFVFGRGGEEALLMRGAGIEFEIVPGISAGIAAPAYAGIPVTHRDRASAVALVTAHEDPSKPESALDFAALARFPGTLVFYMGVQRLDALAERLIAAGRSTDEPAAVIERGTLPGQRAVYGTLATIAAVAREAAIKAPAITLIGEVAALGEQLAWKQPAALSGLTIAVTRARAQSSELAGRLGELGASVIEAPAIRIVPRAVEVPSLSGYDLVVLTSPNGAHILFDRLAERDEDARSLAGATVAAIGPGTARALREHGIIADVIPPRFIAESLAEELQGLFISQALIARAAQARDVLPDALRARGVDVDVLALYDTLAAPLSADRLRAVQAADYVTFTSSSTARFFLEAGELGPESKVVSIGPVTSATLREHGVEPHLEAAQHDIAGLVQAIIDDAGRDPA